MHGIDLNIMVQSERDALIHDLVNWVDLRKALAACAARASRITTMTDHTDTRANADAARRLIHAAITCLERKPET